MQPGPFCSRESITIMGTRTKSIDDVHIAVLENDTHQNAKHRKRRTKIFINNLQIEEQLWKTTFFPTTTKKKINSIDESHLKAHRSFKICGKIVCVFFSLTEISVKSIGRQYFTMFERLEEDFRFMCVCMAKI